MLAYIWSAPYRLKREIAQRLPINSRINGDFILPSTTGSKLSLQQLHGKVVLLTFGFTACADVCPLGLIRLHKVIERLGRDANGLQVIFVSFDPNRDTPYLARYIQHFDPSIIGVTGSEEEIDDITTRYGVVYIKEKTKTKGYNFTHNGYIYLLDQQGHVRKIYEVNAPVKEIINDVHLLQKESALADH
ncbi:MAG: SCO family protein [Gammaproteobacteria bacterium]|nr:SCO family protein [Gammaproteobacteria bacterium]